MRTKSNLSSEKPLAVIASQLNMDGYNLARQFAEGGYDLIVAASNPSVVEEAEDFKELGVDAVSFQLDLTTAEGVEQLYRRIIATGRPVDAMVINANLSTDNKIEKSLAKKILKDMTSRGKGKILFAGNELKEDVSEISESLQDEIKGSGVSVTSIKAGSNEIYFLKKGYVDPFVIQ